MRQLKKQEQGTIELDLAAKIQQDNVKRTIEPERIIIRVVQNTQCSFLVNIQSAGDDLMMVNPSFLSWIVCTWPTWQNTQTSE